MSAESVISMQTRWSGVVMTCANDHDVSAFPSPPPSRSPTSPAWPASPSPTLTPGCWAGSHSCRAPQVRSSLETFKLLLLVPLVNNVACFLVIWFPVSNVSRI